MLVIALTWWFLYATSTPEPPRAAGPYPTFDSCRQAAHVALPRDRQFFTPAQIVEAQEADERAAAAAKAEAAQCRAKTGRKDCAIPVIYGSYIINVDRSAPSRAITACFDVNDDTVSARATR